MFKKFILTFFLLFGFFITIYPSKNENTNLIDYCYCFEKILSRNSLEQIKNVSKKNKSYSKDIALFGTKTTKGLLVKKIIDQYKISKKSYFFAFVPNQFYCLAGYWIEFINPGILQNILYEKSKEKIFKYKDVKKEVDEFLKDINLKINL